MRPLLLVAFAVGCAAGGGQDPVRIDTYAPLPWHLASTRWDLGQEQPFESLAVDVSISDDLPQGQFLYIAPVGLARLGDTTLYGGIQTRMDAITRADPTHRAIGPGFIFSRWGERSMDAIRPGEGGWLESSGHQGDFISARRFFRWTKGSYTFSLRRLEGEIVDGAAHTWVGAYVRPAAGTEIFVGALRFPGDGLRLGREVRNFVEIYGSPSPRSVEIPRVTVTFGPPVVNGRPSPRASARVVYPDGVPDVASAVAREGAIVVTIGTAVRDRSAREELLLGP
jgi:hypothetical protein